MTESQSPDDAGGQSPSSKLPDSDPGGSDQAPTCVACGQPLERIEEPGRVHWECKACGGQAISFAVLGAFVERPFLKRLWNVARQSSKREGRGCFHCREPMASVAGERGTGHPEVDVCPRCVWVWFDGKELETSPTVTRPIDAWPARSLVAELPLKGKPRPSQERALTPVLISVVAIAAIVFGVANYAWRDPPWGSLQSAQSLASAGYLVAAEEVIISLLAAAPLDLDLNHHYIVNHFNIPSSAEERRDDARIEARYRRLSEQAETADLGNYALGLMAALAKQDTVALALYDRVGNRRQKYLNGSIGRSLLRLGRVDEAKPALIREIELGGDVEQAASDLSELYFRNGDFSSLRRLIADPRTGPSVPRHLRRLASLLGGRLTLYVAEDFSLLGKITPAAAIAALLIAAMWFLFLWRIDIFEQEPIGPSLLIFVLGGLSLFLSLAISELLGLLVLAEEPLMFFLHAGVPEETAKILPVLAIARWSWHVNEPVDLLVYGSLSALGFATVENVLYFSNYGPEIAVPRFLSSTIGHMALTGLVCHLYGRARLVRGGSGRAAIAKGLLLAAFLHGVSDLLVSRGLMTLDAIALAALYGWMISNALSSSPYYHDSLATSRRLRNYELLLATAIALVLVTFLYDYWKLGTGLADQRLLQVWRFFWLAVAVFGVVGKLALTRRDSVPGAKGAATA